MTQGALAGTPLTERRRLDITIFISLAITDIASLSRVVRWQAPSVLEARCCVLHEAAVPSEALWQLPIGFCLALFQEPCVVRACHTDIAARRNGIWYHAAFPSSSEYVKFLRVILASMEERHHAVVNLFKTS